MRRARTLLLVFTSVAAALAPAGQAGSARLSGIVVDDRGQSIRLAIVTVIGGSPAERRSTATGDDGGFSFADLSPGRYRLSAAKAAYVGGAYGARRPGDVGTALVLVAGQTEGDLRIVVTRGAAITGIVRDHQGAPAASTEVVAFPAAEQPAAAVPRPASATTDERGVYRLFGLAPGSYTIAARPRVIGAANLAVMSEAEIDRVLRDLQRGVPPLPATTRQQPAVDRNSEGVRTSRFAFAPIFYPGTSYVASAVPLTLRPGDEAQGIDFSLDLVRVAEVRGTVVTADGSQPPPTRVDLETAEPTPLLPTGWKPPPAQVSRDGAFTLKGVLPGEYLLMARSAPATPTTPGTTPSLQWARVPLIIDGSDISGLRILLQPGLRLAGRVVFQRQGGPPVEPAQVRVMIEPAVDRSQSPESRGGSSGRRTAPLRADATFEIAGVLPGRYHVDLLLPGAGACSLQSLLVDGSERLDEGLEIAGADVVDALLTCSDQQSRLSGRLFDAALRPAPDYFVIVFPDDWRTWGGGARRIRATRPDSDGRFLFPDLLPGRYFLSVLTELEPGVWNTPESLNALADAAVLVTLVAGKETAQDLRLDR